MFYRFLDKKYRDQMREHALSDDDIITASWTLKNKQKKSVILYAVLTIVFCVLMLAAGIAQYMIKQVDPVRLVPAMILAVVMVVVLGYFMPIGIFRIQFNRELKNNYPHLYDRCKL